MTDNRTNELTLEQVEAAFEEGMDAIDWGMVRNGEGDPQEAAGTAVRAALVAAQGAAPSVGRRPKRLLNQLNRIADALEEYEFDGVAADAPAWMRKAAEYIESERQWRAPVLPSSTTPQAEAYDHCCQHPKCPGGSLCCCASEQRLRDCWNQWREEIAGDSKQAFRDGYQAGQNDPAPWLTAPVLSSSGVDEDARRLNAWPTVDEVRETFKKPADRLAFDRMITEVRREAAESALTGFVKYVSDHVEDYLSIATLDALAAEHRAEAYRQERTEQ